MNFVCLLRTDESVSFLEEMLAPLSLHEFSEEYLFRSPYAAPFKAGRFRDLISWELLEHIIKTEHEDCWLPCRGQLPDEPQLANGKLTTTQMYEGFAQGRTILVRHAERAHPQLREIADDFYQVFNDPVDIQLYGTPAEQEGFDWHFDAEEVFVIQSVGEKEFRLRPNTTYPWPVPSNIPQQRFFQAERPTPEIRCWLKPGDWLYIPAGYWHKARAITPSFHLSVGIMSTTGVGMLQTLLPKLTENPLWRKRLPLYGIKGDSYREHLRELISHLTSEIESHKFDERILEKGSSYR